MISLTPAERLHHHLKFKQCAAHLQTFMTAVCARLKPLNTKILVAWFIWNAKCNKNAIGVVAATLKLFCILSKTLLV